MVLDLFSIEFRLFFSFWKIRLKLGVASLPHETGVEYQVSLSHCE